MRSSAQPRNMSVEDSLLPDGICRDFGGFSLLPRSEEALRRELGDFVETCVIQMRIRSMSLPSSQVSYSQ